MQGVVVTLYQDSVKICTCLGSYLRWGKCKFFSFPSSHAPDSSADVYDWAIEHTSSRNIVQM